jgi:hypothetical protein
MNFNQSVTFEEHKLPQSITSIEFGEQFNQSIDKLHQSATYRMYCTSIKFGNDSCESFDTLHSSVTVEEHFNQMAYRLKQNNPSIKILYRKLPTETGDVYILENDGF